MRKKFNFFKKFAQIAIIFPNKYAIIFYENFGEGMDDKTFEKEKKYLGNVEKTISNIIFKNSGQIEENKKRIKEFKEYFADTFNEIYSPEDSNDEIANINIQIESLEQNNLTLEKHLRRLEKQKKSPYFGRFDFKANSEKSAKSYYIGIGHLQNEDFDNLVYDWRADISSLYYDDAVGKTSYACNDGEIEGNLSLKRQFKIEQGVLRYYIDSNLVIDDNILMEELSKNSSAKMHDIVSTIQKEQNSLIRSNEMKNVIVQGVAGSGKTSVAMHRVSYLLYKYRKTLKNEDVLILSPSQLFADYIDEVLPSLGDDKPFTTTFATMARKLYGKDFISREKMLDKLITQGKQKDFENIAIKHSFEFLEAFKNFLNYDICNLFMPKTLTFGTLTIEEGEIREIYYNKLKNLPIHKRIEAIAEHIVDLFNVPRRKNPDFFERAKKILYNKMITTDCVRIYNIFLRQMELDEISEVTAYDIAQILLIKENLFGFDRNYDAKYVVVDEMQDYSPCHFYLFEKIWHCPKMYLGDVNQSIDKNLTKEYLTLLAKENKAKIYHLNKSYRSTIQISKFSQKILGKKVANNVNRSGESVKFYNTTDTAQKIEEIAKKHSDKTVCVVCKDMREIRALRKNNKFLKTFEVLDDEKSMTDSKTLLSTIINSKGVEFDVVIVPFANDKNYKTELDRNLLYVASTRALHNLYFIADKKPSRFLVKQKN